jgi:molecular chaperone GrpE
MTDKNLKKELEQVKKKAEEYLAGWQRAKADYLNLQKETEKRIQEVAAFTTANLIIELLPIYDNLKQALSHQPKGSDWAKGIEQIKKQFDEFFKKLGIEPIKTVGERFNPEFHEAVSHEKKEGVESGVIFEEVSAGYKMGDKVVRVAKVKVAK